MMLAWFSSSEMIASSADEQRLEEPAVGVEAGGVQDRVFGAQELADLRFELLVDRLRAADEADGREPVAPAIEPFVAAAMTAGCSARPR